MKILVTGGAGFAGSHIVDTFIAAGHDVVVVDDLSTGSRDNLHPKAKFYEMDINDPALHSMIEAEGIEAISHQAAQIKVPLSIKDPGLDAQINIMGTIQVLEAARKFGLKFIFAASAAMYGTPEYLPIDEQHPLNPLSFYGLSKKVNEDYIRMYGELYGVNYTILRYANIYGPRQGRFGEGGVVSIFLEQMIKGQQVNIEGDGGATRDYIYIGDVAEANLIALTSDKNLTVNISTATQVSVNELYSTMKDLTDYPLEAVHGPARIGDIYHSTMSNRMAVTELGWQPKTSLREGLAKTIEWGRNAYGEQA
ncbi:UDP-glucose 4-epimerase [Tumebacillus algifaecis]|uniref:UDP-glucose 4-epimerase n=1 Tax=Tumebacillus algifaecis TaxID=1214604 RepID=A0A223D558_9BACL|nr:NAD-dependent epimerase/dehydratase family protein [Tumebacillus algifaecis]ASS76556.1 UDP-glucose 4-epimerase [Tumebacillus algifaecis]